MNNIFLILGFVIGLASCKTASKDDAASLTSENGESTTISNNDNDSDSGKAGGLQTVNFPYDSYELTPDAVNVLKGNVQYLKDNSGVRVQAQGHCDERGSTQYNLALGENRANAVKKYLTTAGVSTKRIETIRKGLKGYAQS